MNKLYNLREKIEQNNKEILGAHCADIALALGRISMRFARIERVPRYSDSRHENDAEHSFMLALIAPELAEALELDLDIALVHQYATAHDLIELKTGDVATFMLSKEQFSSKELVERQAVAELLSELPPYNARLVERYEQQSDPESRFVRAVDKLLPVVVDIIGDGLTMLTEDYGVTTNARLHEVHVALQQRMNERFGDEFPDIALAHKVLYELFEVHMLEKLEDRYDWPTLFEMPA